eukprot:SAG31_NODE_4102_length_3582_cov_1.665518_2_plen_79_part_00
MVLGGWLAAVVEQWAGLAIVQTFLANDGSWNAVADSVLLRSLIAPPAGAGEDAGFSMGGRLQVRGCKLQHRLLLENWG